MPVWVELRLQGEPEQKEPEQDALGLWRLWSWGSDSSGRVVLNTCRSSYKIFWSCATSLRVAVMRDE